MLSPLKNDIHLISINFLTSENFVEDPERCLAALARLLA